MKKTRKVIYFPAYYNLKAETADHGGEAADDKEVVWKSHGVGGSSGSSHYFWDDNAGKLVWDHPIPSTARPALVKKVVCHHPHQTHPLIGQKGTLFWYPCCLSQQNHGTPFYNKEKPSILWQKNTNNEVNSYANVFEE